MQDVDYIKDLGSGVIGGVECDYLAFRAKDVDWQIWIAQGERPYPCRYVISSKFMDGSPQYSIQVRDWKTGLVVANLDQRISTTTDAVERAELTHQRALVLEQLNRTILSRGGNGFAAPLPAHELQRLRDAVSGARRSGDKIAEMAAILRLNSAILSQSFTDLAAIIVVVIAVG